MFKVKPISVFVLNILLMLLSWFFYKFPQGDEYLVIFAISLVFIIAPFVLSVRQILVLLSINVGFFIFYFSLGALNRVDIFVLTFLFVCILLVSAVLRRIEKSFEIYYDEDISGKQKKYYSIVDELDNIDRRGRKIETELGRISRLYEITKKLAPALESKKLLDGLFEFLEDNFSFETAHLIICDEDKMSRTISKSLGTEEYFKDKSKVLDYQKLFDYCKSMKFESFYVDAEENPNNLFESMKVQSEKFMVFPLYIGENLRAILAIEGASKSSYTRFSILVPQIVLELRKVELYEKVQELSIIDGLTGVYLRRYLMDRLREEVDRAQRLKLTFSVGMIDVDNFKKCNDNHGHLVGDVVLKRIAERMKASVREVDMIARYGGEEFCVVLPETTKSIAINVAERLRKAVEGELIKAFDEKIRATISMGVSSYPDDGKTVEALIDKADTALYKAKRKGRNRVFAA